jgi:hypothetical protein
MKMYRNAKAVGISILLVAVLGVLITGATRNNQDQRVEPAPQTQISNLTKQPIRFIENQGQWDPQVAYMARKQGMTAWLQKHGITFQFEKSTASDHAQGVTLQMTFENASDWVSLDGEEQQISKHNFFIGYDRNQWRSGVPSYAQVIYRELYDDVDLRVREAAGWLEYDLLLSEGADLSDVVICCEGVKNLEIDENGYLVMETEYGPITQQPPTAWYEASPNMKIPVVCNFRLIDDQRYGFEVENDLGLALVIDPGLEWSTFLGGNNFDRAICLGVGVSGNVIVSGETWSYNFPTSLGAYDTTHNGGNSDIFVSCLTVNGDSLLWSTFLGGTGRDEPYDLAVDNSDRPTIAGITMSSDFPTTSSAFDAIFDGPIDALMFRLNADGSDLVYSTYLGGSEEDWICTIELNDSNEAYIGGYTSSPDFPTTPGTYDTTHNGLRDAFVAHMNSAGSELLYSTFIGGSDYEGWTYDTLMFFTRQMALAVAVSGEVVIAGITASLDFPTTAGAYDTSSNGSYDVFVTRLDTTASNIIYSTYLGGTSFDYAYAKDIVLSPTGIITIAGATLSDSFPTTVGAYDSTYNGYYDGFVAQFDATASNLLYSTYIGGTEEDAVASIISDDQNKIIIAGICAQGFPTTAGAFDTLWNGLEDVFISRMSLDGNGPDDLLYSTYLGGGSYEWATSVAVTGDSTVVLAGQASPSFPTTPGAYDPSYNGGNHDAFVCKFSPYVGIEENTTTEPLASLVLSSVHPNPSHRQFNYTVSLDKSQEVQVSVYDITGRLVKTLIDRRLPAGVHAFSWRPDENIASGTYFMKLVADGHSETRKVMLVR